MGWYGKYEEDSPKEKLIKEIEKSLEKKEEYDGGNIRAIKSDKDEK